MTWIILILAIPDIWYLPDIGLPDIGIYIWKLTSRKFEHGIYLAYIRYTLSQFIYLVTSVTLLVRFGYHDGIYLE